MKDKGYENHIQKLKVSTLKMFINPFLNMKLSEEKDVLLKIYDDMKANISKLNDNKNKSIYIHFEKKQTYKI